MKTALFLSELLSFRYLALGLFVARMAKYFLFGVYGFGLKWDNPPSFYQQFEFVLDHCMIPYLGIVVVAYVIDRLVGPVFFREEIKELRKIVYN